MSLKETRDPGLYRQLSMPLDSVGAATEAIDAFYNDLSEIRKKHHIPNLYVVLAINWLDGEGEESTAVMTSMWGDQAKAVSLTAYAYGQETAKHEEFIGGMVKQGKKR